jgi:hypothetical protein
MKIKVIKKAELEALGEQQETAKKTPERPRLKRVVEKWVAEIHERAEAEERISFDNLFHTNPESST